MNAPEQIRLEATVTGTVQGVGFRYRTQQQADQLGLTGAASNQADGSVSIVAEGPEPAVRALAQWLDSGKPPGQVQRVDATYAEATSEFSRFRAR